MLQRRHIVLGLGAAALGLTSIAEALATPDMRDPENMYAALRSSTATKLIVGASTINIVFAEAAGRVDREMVLAWVRDAADAVSAYFGRFPIDNYGLLVITEPGAAVGHATTFGYAGAATHISVGLEVSKRAFERDWVLVHEMMHAALPNLPRRALWLQEGNATYVEPIARAIVGQLPALEVWREAIIGMSKGLPQPGEGGLDGTGRWGRLYWGGATFWLLAEIAIYTQSDGRHALRDALRKISRDSGGNTKTWSPEQLMHVGDEASGSRALSTLYAQFAQTAVEVDLAATFHKLGIVSQPDGSVQFETHAPLAGLRDRITAR